MRIRTVHDDSSILAHRDTWWRLKVLGVILLLVTALSVIGPWAVVVHQTLW